MRNHDSGVFVFIRDSKAFEGQHGAGMARESVYGKIPVRKGSVFVRRTTDPYIEGCVEGEFAGGETYGAYGYFAAARVEDLVPIESLVSLIPDFAK